MSMESDRRLNRWGLTFTPAVINRLRKVAIYGQPQLSLEHQGRAKRYVVRGVESGGATEEVGYYVTFAGESGEALTWLQTIDSLVSSQWTARGRDRASGYPDRDAARCENLRTLHYPPSSRRSGSGAPSETPCRRIVSRRAWVPCAGTLGQGQGSERLCPSAVLHTFRRRDRIAGGIR